MGYISKWESLSEAADHIMSWTDVALEEARADLCKAMSDGSLEIRAKLAKHATKLQTSASTVEGTQLQIPIRLRPDDIDWRHSRPQKPWLLVRPLPRHHGGEWYLDLIEVCRESVTGLFSASETEAAPPGVKPAVSQVRKAREPAKRKAAELIIHELYPFLPRTPCSTIRWSTR